MLKNTLIIALVIVIIYLYYQQKQQNNLANFTGSNANLEEISEVKKVNQIMADFCKNEIGGKDIQEIRTKLNGRKLTEILAENEDYETKTDELTRQKGELEAEITLLTNSHQNQIKEKGRINTRLNKEKSELEAKLLEAQKKYKNKAKLLDEEQCENNKLTEQNEFYLESIQTKEEIISDYQKEIQELEAKITSLESEDLSKLFEDKKPK